MYPFSLLNICYGYTCPEMRTAGALINGLKCQLGFVIVFIGFSTFLAQNAHFTSSSKTEQIKFPLLSNKEQQWNFSLCCFHFLQLYHSHATMQTISQNLRDRKHLESSHSLFLCPGKTATNSTQAKHSGKNFF